MCTDQKELIAVMDSVKEFLLEMKEENDRAVVIIGAANVDLLLKQLIERSLLLKLKKEDELLGPDSPLSDFSSKINLCYRIGLIDKRLSKVLHILRKLRNDFAHKVKGCNLNASPYSDQVGELIKDFKDSLTLEKIRHFFPGASDSSRDFRIVLSLISSLLEMKLRYLPKTKKANPASISWITENVEGKPEGVGP